MNRLRWPLSGKIEWISTGLDLREIEMAEVLESVEVQEMTPPSKVVSISLDEIRDKFMKIRGYAKGYLRADVRHLFKNRFRVNVWADVGTGPKICDSQFVKILDDGTCQLIMPS